ncbi:hypothetical protein ALP84_00654 [Pseudomonas cichorii]|uniref:Uncharacterized protein n=1 Tax=Pseudomonas cichorii TaxID=36746 RepID=A0A3M4VHY7_PSECI|nr:hypothetical protein ALP84_00654 [Pseudomonas cichorii]SDP28641.1 hypothetical protein SAMN05216599_1305 [Pseudomonas cichorii]
MTTTFEMALEKHEISEFFKRKGYLLCKRFRLRRPHKQLARNEQCSKKPKARTRDLNGQLLKKTEFGNILNNMCEQV